MPNIFIIIQARMSSTRLPGKVLLPLAGKSVLEIMIDRLKDLKDNILIATTNDGTELPIVDLCNKLNVNYYRGDTANVLSRYYEAAIKLGAVSGDGIMRLTSDCPLVDYNLIKDVIHTYENNSFNMVRLGPHSGFPRGLDACIFDFKVLERTHLSAVLDTDKEHVTLGMSKYNNLSYFDILAEEDWSQYRLTLDEEDDYILIKKIYKKFNDQTNFNFTSLIKLLKDNPTLADINKHVEQKLV